MENDKTEHSFVRSRLPWLVAAGGFLLYLITLDRSLSLNGVTGLARMAGWDWHPVVQAPLFHVLSLPIRWLPSSWQLTAGSLFSALCAVLTLALLARSVSLLPHDRTREQRLHQLGEHGLLDLPTAWLAPLLAVLVCALQLSFWELATAPSGEMLDLLIFAYVIRCLLEYRVDGRESWLARMAFVYGLGAANNWAMIGYFPAFLIALVWMMGWSFFRYRFLVRTTLCGVAGLLLYLLLPLIQASSDPVSGDFFQALRTNLGFQKLALSAFRPYLLVLLSLSSLLPVLIISIRWPTSMGDVSAAGYKTASLMMYALHAGFLAICLYSAFDPPLSPRQLGADTGTPLLSLYYLGALCVGYFCGFFLLLSGSPPARLRERVSSSQQSLNSFATGLIFVAALGVSAALFGKNIREILARNSDELDRYGQHLAESLPATGSVVLSDDPIRLYALRAALGPEVDRHILLDSSGLGYALYYRHLQPKYGSRLPEPPKADAKTTKVTELDQIEYLAKLGAKLPLFYLHPSFGYYFERFYQVPHRAVYELKLLPPNVVETPALSGALVQEQDDYWKRLDQEELGKLKPKVERYQGMKKRECTLLWVGSFYSRALDDWGVELGVNRQLDKAIVAYQRALELNPQNPCAFVNLEWTRHWKKTGKMLDRFSDEAVKRLRPFSGNWDLLLSVNGPLDEPAFRFELARKLMNTGLSRQAVQEVRRLLDINPADMAASIMLGNIYLQAGFPDRALELVNKIRSDPAVAPKETKSVVGLIAIEAWVAYARGDQAKAEGMLRAAQQTYPQEETAFAALAQIYMTVADQSLAEGKQADYLQSMTNALKVLEKQTRDQPSSASALSSYGGICAKLGDYARGLEALNKAVQLDPGSQPALLNRAIVFMRLGRDAEARRDYERLKQIDPKDYRAHFGLADIAYRKKDWFAARNSYEDYLSYAPRNTPEYLDIQKRVKELKKKPGP